MNLASSLVESYMYADMFNREYEGGSNMQERIYTGGLPVAKIVPSIGKDDYNNNEEANGVQEGGKRGPFANKVVPVGLVIINSKECSNTEYENHFHPGVQREVIPDSLYETLIMSVVSSNKRRITPRKSRNQKQTSRKIKSNAHKE